MTIPEIQNFIMGEWISITPEVRPSQNFSQEGKILPFYLTRQFIYAENDQFECHVTNFADPYAKVPLVKISIIGHLKWQGEHLLAAGAYNVDYVADSSYEITPLHPGFVQAANQFKQPGLDPWEVNLSQSILRKNFPLFGLSEGQIYVDYDLIFIYENLLFNGSKNVDGRAFDKAENRPTNLQIPLIRK